MNYKRLTERTKHGIAVLDSGERSVLSCGVQPTTKALNRLAELEDKIENGLLVEPTCCNKNIKFYFNRKEIPFEELSEIPQMTTDHENHTITNIVLHYIGKDAIYFYTKTEHYTVADGADEEYYGEM